MLSLVIWQSNFSYHTIITGVKRWSIPMKSIVKLVYFPPHIWIFRASYFPLCTYLSSFSFLSIDHYDRQPLFIPTTYSKNTKIALILCLLLKRDDIGLPPFFVSKQQLSRATLVYSKDIRKTGMLAGNLWWSDKFFTRIIDGAGCVVCMTFVHCEFSALPDGICGKRKGGSC